MPRALPWAVLERPFGATQVDASRGGAGYDTINLDVVLVGRPYGAGTMVCGIGNHAGTEAQSGLWLRREDVRDGLSHRRCRCR